VAECPIGVGFGGLEPTGSTCMHLLVTRQGSVLTLGGSWCGGRCSVDFQGHVTVLERTSEAGKKILMSGGARCNVLPYEVDVQRDFVTDSPKSALRAVFASWGVWECWSWLADADHVGLDLSLEESSNKWFPTSNSSKDVRNKLVAACECGSFLSNLSSKSLLNCFVS
jgi:predicted flavoprotein YhiN